MSDGLDACAFSIAGIISPAAKTIAKATKDANILCLLISSLDNQDILVIKKFFNIRNYDVCPIRLGRFFYTVAKV